MKNSIRFILAVISVLLLAARLTRASERTDPLAWSNRAAIGADSLAPVDAGPCLPCAIE